MGFLFNVGQDASVDAEPFQSCVPVRSRLRIGPLPRVQFGALEEPVLDNVLIATQSLGQVIAASRTTAFDGCTGLRRRTQYARESVLQAHPISTA